MYEIILYVFLAGTAAPEHIPYKVQFTSIEECETHRTSEEFKMVLDEQIAWEKDYHQVTDLIYVTKCELAGVPA